MQDPFLRQKNTWPGSGWAMQDMFILHLGQKIAQRLVKPDSIRQEPREGFSDTKTLVMQN